MIYVSVDCHYIMKILQLNAIKNYFFKGSFEIAEGSFWGTGPQEGRRCVILLVQPSGKWSKDPQENSEIVKSLVFCSNMSGLPWFCQSTGDHIAISLTLIWYLYLLMTIFQAFELSCSDVSYDNQFILWSSIVFCFRGIELSVFHFFLYQKGMNNIWACKWANLIMVFKA